MTTYEHNPEAYKSDQYLIGILIDKTVKRLVKWETLQQEQDSAFHDQYRLHLKEAGVYLMLTSYNVGSDCQFEVFTGNDDGTTLDTHFLPDTAIAESIRQLWAVVSNTARKSAVATAIDALKGLGET